MAATGWVRHASEGAYFAFPTFDFTFHTKPAFHRRAALATATTLDQTQKIKSKSTLNYWAMTGMSPGSLAVLVRRCLSFSFATSYRLSVRLKFEAQGSFGLFS